MKLFNIIFWPFIINIENFKSKINHDTKWSVQDVMYAVLYNTSDKDSRQTLTKHTQEKKKT